MKSLLILGCGWVGRALREALKPSYNVDCVVKNRAIDSRDYTLDMLANNLDIFNAKSVVIAIPAKGNYLKELEYLTKYINPKSQIIMLSSTSIYPKIEAIYSEDSILKSSSNLIAKAEQYLQNIFKDITILRLGGLMGYNRVCGKYTANKKIQDRRVNYIHRDDVVAIIKQIVEQNIRDSIYNLIAPMHPKHSLVTAKTTKKFGFKKTKYNPLKTVNRVIISSKLEDELKYTFLKPNPLYFWK